MTDPAPGFNPPTGPFPEDTIPDLTDMTGAASDETQRFIDEARRAVEDSPDDFDSRNASLDRLDALSRNVWSAAATGQTGGITRPVEEEINRRAVQPSQATVETENVRPSTPEATVSPKPEVRHPVPNGPTPDPITDRAVLIGLLLDGEIEKFNEVRPSGKLDFRGVDLSFRNLAGADLRHVDLTRATLNSSDLTGARLQHAILDHADLSETTLTEAKLFQAQLRHADLRKVKDAHRADFQEASLRGAELDGGNFSGAFFNNARLITAFLVGTSFAGAHLEGAWLAGASMSEANFSGANLRRARMFQANGADVDFSNAILNGAEAVQSHFTSSEKKRGDGSTIRTCFTGAWVKDFSHHGAIPAELLIDANPEGYPPEGYFPVTPQPDDERILVNGIPGSDKVLYDAAMEELNELIGLKEVKQYIKQLMEHFQASQARVQLGLPPLDYTLHKVYTGSPGTGKTTIARIESRLLHALGGLAKGHLVETDKTGLIAGYAGQTLDKTDKLVDSALGGTLLIDEAYALTQSKDDSYAQDAIAVLTKRLEDDRDKFACIACGYKKEMKQFIEANSGLKSRFSEFVDFPDYSTGELVDIMKLMLDKKKFTYTDTTLLGDTSLLLAAIKAKEGDEFGNGRAVRMSVEKMSRRMSSRLVSAGQLDDRAAHLAPHAEDLPFQAMLEFDRNLLPALTELRWQDENGKEYSVTELPSEGAFPSLTDESYDKVVAHVQAAISKLSEEK